MEQQLNTTASHKDIIGWGADLDPKDRPAVPYWQKPEGGTGAHWTVPEQQPNFVDFHSIERPTHTHVFGTSVAPSGLSGLIRAFAFRYSEGSWGHWIPLLMADRVNMIEGIFSDLFRGHIPNVFQEMGLGAEWKYNKKNFIKKAVIFGAFAAFLIPVIGAVVSNKKRGSSKGTPS